MSVEGFKVSIGSSNMPRLMTEPEQKEETCFHKDPTGPVHGIQGFTVVLERFQERK